MQGAIYYEIGQQVNYTIECNKGSCIHIYNGDIVC